MRNIQSLKWLEENVKLALRSSPYLGGVEYLVFRLREVCNMADVRGNNVLCLLATVAVGMAQGMVSNFCSGAKKASECCSDCVQLRDLADAMAQIAQGDQPAPEPAPSPENAGKPQAPKPAAK